MALEACKKIAHAESARVQVIAQGCREVVSCAQEEVAVGTEGCAARVTDLPQKYGYGR